MAQTVTPELMCRCTARKFCRKIPSETSAQVGRVAVRLAISMVATRLIIAALVGGIRLLPYYSPRLIVGVGRARSSNDSAKIKSRLLGGLSGTFVVLKVSRLYLGAGVVVAGLAAPVGV